MKKGYYRAMVALLAAPLIGSTLVSCGDNQVQSEFEKVEITNKADLQAEWHERDGARTVEFKVTKTDGTIIEGLDIDDLIADGKVLVTSSNTSVITVGNDTDLSVVAAGESTITIKVGDKTDTVVITVLEYVDPIQNKPERVTTPVVGTAYKLGIEQYGLSTPSMLYLKSKVLVSTYYIPSTPTFGEGLDVVLEEVPGASDDYKYYLKFTEGGSDWYYGAVVSDDFAHVNDAIETTPTTKWKWDAEHQALLTYLNIPAGEGHKESGDYYIGTYGDKNTFSLSSMDKIADSYPAHLYVIPQVMDITKTAITLINGVRDSEKINVLKPQGELSFVKKSGDDCVTIGTDGTLTAAAIGECVITVSDTKTSIDVTVVVRDPVKGEIQTNPLTVSEFITEALKLNEKGGISEESYYVKGDVASMPSKDKIYFDAKNYIYKLQDSTGKAFESVEAMGFFPGDEIFVYGKLENYYGTAEMVSTKLIESTHKDVEVTSSGEHATVSFTEGVTAGKATNGSTIKFTVEVAAGYELVSVKVNGTVVEPVETVYSHTVKGPVTVVVTTKQEGSTEEIWSEITLSAEGGENAATAKITYSGTEYDGLKGGTSSKAGKLVVKIPQGAKKLTFFAAGWKGVSVKMEVSGSCLAEAKSYTLNSDDGVSGNPPFTLVGTTDANFFYSIDFASALTEETSLTFLATANYRFILWNVCYC